MMFTEVSILVILTCSTYAGPIQEEKNVNKEQAADDPKLYENDPLLYLQEKTFNKVIIDTDGSVDDATAILMGLSDSKIEIIAITTSAGHAALPQVVRNVLRTFRAVNSSEVKLYAGSDQSILVTPPFGTSFGEDGFGDVRDPDPPKATAVEGEHAVSAMIRLVHEHPKEITILALGPLTNTALAMRLDYEFKHLVKDIVWVGGSIRGVGNVKPSIEFNAYFDPPAAWIVFNETVSPIIMIPWETLSIATMISTDWRVSVLGVSNSTVITFLNKLEDKYLYGKQWVTGDAKGMAMVLNPKIIMKASYHHVEPIWCGEFTQGLTLVDYDSKTGRNKNAIIVEDMDVEEFKKMVIERFIEIEADTTLPLEGKEEEVKSMDRTILFVWSQPHKPVRKRCNTKKVNEK